MQSTTFWVPFITTRCGGFFANFWTEQKALFQRHFIAAAVWGYLLFSLLSRLTLWPWAPLWYEFRQRTQAADHTQKYRQSLSFLTYVHSSFIITSAVLLQCAWGHLQLALLQVFCLRTGTVRLSLYKATRSQNPHLDQTSVRPSDPCLRFQASLCYTTITAGREGILRLSFNLIWSYCHQGQNSTSAAQCRGLDLRTDSSPFRLVWHH